MLLIFGALFTVAAVVFLICFIESLFYLRIEGLKEFLVFAIIAIVCTGTGFFVESLLYEEVTVNEYEIVYVGENTFSYKTEDGGIFDKPKVNTVVYKSDDDNCYAVERVTTVTSKINKYLHWFITFSNELGDQEVTYKIYLPEEKYQEYISK